jgi:signal transduction histidine kinase
MMENDNYRHALSIDRYPGPVCSYRFRDGEPVVGETNDAFEAAFGSVTAGTRLTDVFEEYGIEPVDGSELLPALFTRDHHQPVHVGGVSDDRAGSQYLAQVVTPDGDRPGHILFGDTSASPDQFGVDRVASVISHDLRNPLDVAKARLRAGREMDEDEHLAHVEQAHDRMERIIQDVLTLARGEEVIEPEGTVDLGAVARDAWETVETNGASLTVVDPLPSTVADRDRVKRLFENLFRNSVEHGSTSSRAEPGDAVEHGSASRQPAAEDPAERGSTGQESNAQEGADGSGNREELDGANPSVSITVGRLESDGDVGFYVADDGPGIPEGKRSVVFRPGYSSDEHGTGLGLAIVRRIADVHGWGVSVTGGDDGGTRFEIRGVDPA